MRTCIKDECDSPTYSGTAKICRNHYLQEWRSRPDVKKRISKSCHRRFRTPKGRFNIGKGAAKARGISWDLSFSIFSKLLGQPCFYCNALPIPNTGKGIDRINSSKGYTKENVVPCCWQCNWIKCDKFTPNETRIMALALKEYRSLNTK